MVEDVGVCVKELMEQEEKLRGDFWKVENLKEVFLSIPMSYCIISTCVFVMND